MHFLDGATKQIKIKITHKICSFILIDLLFYFCRRNNIFSCIVGKSVVPKLLYKFLKGFYKRHFLGRVTVEKNLVA